MEAVSIAVLLLATVPGIRVVGRPALWRRQRGLCLVVTLALTAFGLLLAAAWHWFPGVLQPAALAGLGGSWFAWRRARPGYGTGRGLPPGRLGVVDSLRSLVDHRYYLDEAARYGSVFKMSQFHRPVACVNDLEMARELLREHEDRLRPPPLPFQSAIPRGFVRYMAPGDHRRYRGALKSIIRPEIVDANRDRIRTACRLQLERMYTACAGSAGVRPARAMRSLCHETFPAIFFGLEPGDDAFGAFQSHYCRLNDHGVERGHSDELEEILGDIESIVRVQAARMAGFQRQPRSFLEALVAADPAGIEDETLRRNLIFLMQITRNEVAGLLTWVWYFVARHPDTLDSVRAEPAPGRLVSWRSPATAADRIVAETLRMEQSEYLYRKVDEDICWRGFLIPRGWLLRIGTREAHQSTLSFHEPERFHPERFLDNRYSLSQYAPFGADRHSCLGTHLAFTVCRCMLYELAAGYDVQLVRAGGRKRSGRHWAHWKPDGSFNVAIGARTTGEALRSRARGA